MGGPSLRSRLLRRKNLPEGDLSTKLKRCLTTFDVTMLGVGHMIGAGIYVFTGAVIHNTAGPSIIFSFLLAGLAALLSALCYAEFGARFPKAGSAYTYAYVGCGELWAFVIGWNIVLEYTLAGACVARSMSAYLNSMTNDYITNLTISTIGSFGESGSLIGAYPDFVSVIILVVASAFVAVGSKEATNFNTFFAAANLLIITFVVGYGSTFADFANWQGTTSDGHSRFMPYGVNGMLAGAATCFYAYVGLDGLATAGEECKNPSRSIPRATYFSMLIVSVAYVLMAGVLSLMQPYDKVHPTAAFADAFAALGSPWAKYLVSIGALCGMTTSIVGAVFSLPRCVYAMAADGLIFEWWARVNSTTRTPLNAVVTFSSLAAIIAFLLDVEVLLEFLSIGTLMAYSIVSASLILLRYSPAPISPTEPHIFDKGGQWRIGNRSEEKYRTDGDVGYNVHYALGLLIAAITAFGVLFSTKYYSTLLGSVLFLISVVCIIGSTVFIDLHHQNSIPLDFKVFLVPYVPAVSLFINILMMTHLTFMTWIRIAVWMSIGLAIYLLYGLRHSKEEHKMAERLTRGTCSSVTIASNISDPFK